MSDTAKIECVPNGPLRVHGLADLRNSKGTSLPTKDVTVLCRCGGSANKPYCDGTHRSNGFTSAKLDDRCSGRSRG
jgi:CDGSH-type Zn-finger protein